MAAKNGIYIVMRQDGFSVDGNQAMHSKTDYSFFDKKIAQEVVEALMNEAHGLPGSKQRKALDSWISPVFYVEKEEAKDAFPKELEKYRTKKSEKKGK